MCTDAMGYMPWVLEKAGSLMLIGLMVTSMSIQFIRFAGFLDLLKDS